MRGTKDVAPRRKPITQRNLVHAPPALTGRTLRRTIHATYEDVKIVSPDTVATFTTVQSTEPDLVHKEMGATGPSSWMLGGIEGNRELRPGLPMAYGPGPRSFGKEGAGGQNGFADPDTGLSVGFLRNQLSFTSPLQHNLVDALYACLPR